MTFRTVIKEVALQQGVYATFMPKPLADHPGTGMHTHLSLFEGDTNAFHEAGIKVVVLGERAKLSKPVLAAIERTEARTANNTEGTLALCFNYGGQQELVHAVQTIVKKGFDEAAITTQTIADNLYQPEIPPADLLIRTSGELRTSGFMLWRAAYAELFFIDKLWPDFTEADLDTIVADYRKRDRRFGA